MYFRFLFYVLYFISLIYSSQGLDPLFQIELLTTGRMVHVRACRDIRRHTLGPADLEIRSRLKISVVIALTLFSVTYSSSA